ncbi:hypothetical protein IW262DRAFT_1347864 [Armillaria fumosa]|nr:hypothetical protein IW262DRAFT_1347864 [Armillaria fumosa]
MMLPPPFAAAFARTLDSVFTAAAFSLDSARRRSTGSVQKDIRLLVSNANLRSRHGFRLGSAGNERKMALCRVGGAGTGSGMLACWCHAGSI